MRTSAPSALESNRLFDEPGTRSMSPKEQKITSGRCEIDTALSINSSGVTQTGQPGPCTSVISFGSKSSRPLLTMVCVCPPQTSMMVQGRVTWRRMAWASCSAAFGSRYSLRNFTQFLFQHPQLFEVFEDLPRLDLVDDADGKSYVNEHIIPHSGLGRVREIDFFADAAEIDLGAAESDVAIVHDLEDPAWNCKTHANLREPVRPQGLKPLVIN